MLRPRYYNVSIEVHYKSFLLETTIATWDRKMEDDRIEHEVKKGLRLIYSASLAKNSYVKIIFSEKKW